MSVNFAFLDSGTGGLPYLTYLKQKCPDAKCVYLADTKNFPYGEKTPQEIIECASSAVKLIVDRWNPNAVVIACNTISVTALDELRCRFPSVPIVGTVPAIKPAAEISKKRCIGLLATNATVKSPYILQLCKKFAAGCRVVTRADAELISFIEHRLFSASAAERAAAVKGSVDFFAENGCDVIILACTHFLNMADDIAKASESFASVVDSREGVVSRALAVESCRISDTYADEPRDSELFVTGFTKSSDSEVYRAFCRNMHISFGGILK